MTKMRVRKAWAVGIEHTCDIKYAATRSEAKGIALAYLRYECGIDGATAVRMISAVRAPSHDILLPPEHWLVAELSQREREIVSHAYGSDGNRIGWRDHYITSPGNIALLRLAWVFGLFDGPHEGAYGVRGDALYRLTDLGKLVARSMIPTYRGW